MDIQKVLEELDRLISEQKIEKIPSFLDEKCLEAQKGGKMDALLVLYNEAMGFYRETGNYAKSISAAESAMKLVLQMGLAGDVVYATTLLNAANAYRAAGFLEKSLALYTQVIAIYENHLDKSDMYFANLYNNLSLVYQELQDYKKAKDALLKALAICRMNQNTDFEIAVTYANLANTCIRLEQNEDAMQYGKDAVCMFEALGITDAHYSAALSALGSLYYKQGIYEQAAETMEKARECVAKTVGRNNLQYKRLTENLEVIRNKYHEEVIMNNEQQMSGMELCRQYYEAYGKKMIAEKFPEYEANIAVGLVGYGSECFGYDDELSKDHDFGPRFMMWLSKETYEKIGEELQKAYEELPTTFLGVERTVSRQGKNRSGVFEIQAFYEKFLGNAAGYFGKSDDLMADEIWLNIPEYALAAAVNGNIFCDKEGTFSLIRSLLQAYYPKAVWYRLLATECALFSQNGQYNLLRMHRRGQLVAAQLARAECVKHAMKLCYLLQKQYAPHDKWLFQGLKNIEENKGLFHDACAQVGMEESVLEVLEKICLLSIQDEEELSEIVTKIESLATIFAYCLQKEGIVGHAEVYLDANTTEMIIKSDALLAIKEQSVEELSLMIAKAEFEAFDKVRNEGGRASCQNDWYTFRIMRMSQYQTWDEEMLLQYLADFVLSLQKGRNMIEEKYARMMESTAPREYEKFANILPEISEERRHITEEIVRIQVQWMEEFAREYPGLAENARSIHTTEDTPYNTSYETYLRGEIDTYSDKMLELYGRYIVKHVQEQKNVAKEIMHHTIQFYGYASFEDAMKK